ncbi:MAG: serine--tRNA ligase, partial [Nitrospirae bacterium]|nr:serine--tRNA ligase [Nitrospirota bacterium]
MLDAKIVREDTARVEESLRKRSYGLSILDRFLKIENERRELLRLIEEKREQRNKISQEIAKLKREKKDAASILAEAKNISDFITEKEERLKVLEEEARQELLVIPNIPHESVPKGKDETENVEIRKWGAPKEFDFPPLNHWDIAAMLDIIDFDRASKIAGARFSLMKGMGARLERALMNFMLDLNTSKGYKEILPPLLVNRESMTGTGQLPKFEMELFKTADPEFYLIPTAEVPVTNIHREEILNENDLPIYYTA